MLYIGLQDSFLQIESHNNISTNLTNDCVKPYSISICTSICNDV